MFTMTGIKQNSLIFDNTDVVVCVFQVKDLLWNSDSSVLAVWLEDMAVGDDKQVNTCSKFCAQEDKNVHKTLDNDTYS